MSPRVRAAVISVVLVGATLSPLVRDPVDDGFPLSTYPMFATERPTRLRMSYALGVTTSGERRYLRPFLVGSTEVLQAFTIVALAVHDGPRAQRRLCTEIANRVAASGDTELATIRIVTGSHDALDVLLHDKLGHEVERVRCRVPPRGGAR